jgi:hypothetical protein
MTLRARDAASPTKHFILARYNVQPYPYIAAVYSEESEDESSDEDDTFSFATSRGIPLSM